MSDNEEVIIYDDDNQELEQVKNEKNKDYFYARNNIKTLIEQGMNVANDLKALAEDTESIRAYEAYTSLTAILSANNKLLVDMGRDVGEIKETKEKEDKNVTNNTLIVGTTTDVQKMIEDKLKEQSKNR